MSEISQLLQKARNSLDSSESSTSPTYVVIGNESCDLDSVCCAVVYAHYLSVINPSCSCIPLLNCHREDISLRQDVVWLMEHLNIDYTQFMHYPEEFDPSDYKDLQLTLVDHNVPDEKLRPYVIEIIDHHVDAEAIDCPRVMEFVGSCSTLVAERLINNKDYEMPSEIATLLLSAILTDTSNLDKERVTTDKDESVAMCLKDLVDITTDEIYNKICTARYNISNLTTLQLLRADFKQSVIGSFHVGFSTVRSLMTKLITERDKFEQDMTTFCGQKGLQLLVILGVQMKPLQRQIGLYQPHNVIQDLVDSVAVTLEASADLQVERVGEGMYDGIIFEQGNLSITRKQIVPIVTRCLQQSDLEDSFGSNSIEPLVLTEQEIIVTNEETEVDDKQSQLSDKNTSSNKDDEEDLQSQGSLLQLESISARLGESLDSFALAQDSDQGGHSPGSSRTSSSYNITASFDKQEETRPPPPLEPFVDIVSPLDTVQPPVLPEEPSVPNIPEYTSDQEIKETRDFRTIIIDGQERRINLKFIEQYRPIIQHGGYLGNEQTAVIVISACYLPCKQLHNYPQMISQLFFYVLSVVEKLVVDDYVLVYLHSGAPRNSMPGIQWFHKFYRMIDRRLRKNLKHLYIVHPSFWVKTMLRLARPLISRKFYRKVHYISSLKLLSSSMAMDSLFIPNAVQSADQFLNPEDYKNSE